MEIVDYLRIARRRLWVLIGVPVLAAAITAFIVLSGPTMYTGTTTVSAPALVGGSTSNQYSGSQAVNQFVAQFQAQALSPGVRQAVSKDTGVAATDITNDLTVTQVGASSVMTLTFTGPKKSVVAPVLNSVTKETLNTMFGSQVALAEGQVAAASDGVSATNTAIANWEKTNNMVEPTRVYQSLLDRINGLQQQQASLLANGHATGAAAVASSIATARTELPRFGPLLAQFQVLTTQRDAAVNALTQSRQALSAAHAQQSAADPAKVAYTGPVAAVDKKSALLTTVLPVTGAAVFVAIALVAMLELLSRSRAASARSRSERRAARGGADRTPVNGNGKVPAGVATNGNGSGPVAATPANGKGTAPVTAAHANGNGNGNDGNGSTSAAAAPGTLTNTPK